MTEHKQYINGYWMAPYKNVILKWIRIPRWWLKCKTVIEVLFIDFNLCVRVNVSCSCTSLSSWLISNYWCVNCFNFNWWFVLWVILILLHYYIVWSIVKMTWLTEYLCHKWPWLCSTCRKHFLVLSSCMTYHQICNYINTTGVTSEPGTAYPSGAPEFTPGF